MLNSIRKSLGFALLGIMLMTAAAPVIFATPQSGKKKGGKKGGKRGSKGPVTKGGRGGSK